LKAYSLAMALGNASISKTLAVWLFFNPKYEQAVKEYHRIVGVRI
jgi:hypothetical protein